MKATPLAAQCSRDRDSLYRGLAIVILIGVNPCVGDTSGPSHAACEIADRAKKVK